MKGLILAGGKGTRLRPLTFTRAKQLIPIANKPNLFYVVEDLANAGIRSVGVIVNPETAEEVQGALGDGSQWGLRFTFIPQDAPLGLAHAVKTARSFLDDDPFVMYLGDNLLSGGIKHLVEEYEAQACDALVLLTKVDDPRAFGVAVLDAEGHVRQLIEKPQEPPSDLALVGVYLFSPAVHGAIDALKPSWRGELEITDAVQALIDQGRSVRAHLVRGWWKDTGKPRDLLDANRLILSSCLRDIRGVVEHSDIVGEVVIEPDAHVTSSVIRGPAHVAADAVVDHSYIGPYTSLGRRTQVVHSEVEYSILFDDAEVHNLPYRLDSSVLGQGARVDGDGDGPRKHTLRLVLGDRSEVKL